MAQYHVTLDGQGLILDLQHYRQRPAPPLRLAQDERAVLRPELQVGTLEQSHASGTEQGFRALASFRGQLYAGSSSSGQVLKFDGSTWTVATTIAGVSGIGAMAEYGGKLYVSNTSNGQVASTADGATWTVPQFTVSGASGIWAMAVYPVGGQLRLYVVADQVLNITTAARVYFWDGSTLSPEQFALLERWARAATVHGGTLYAFGAELDPQRHGSVYTLSGSSWSLDRPLPDSYAVAAASLDAPYLAMANGTVTRLVGPRSDLVGTVPNPTALSVFGGALWAACRDGDNLVHLRRYDGDRWSIPFSGAPGEAGGLAAYAERLHLGAGATIHRTTTAYAPTGAVKRQWELAALLEGSHQLPLITLDGTPEPLTAAQLSAALWQRVANPRPYPYTDLDGASYTVWIHAYEERLAPRSTRDAYHRAAHLTLTEA